MKLFSKYIFLLLAVITALYYGCQTAESPKADEAVAPVIFNVTFNAFPPKDLPANSSDTALIKFAWEEFLALNWKSSFHTNGLRDYPDTTWSWSSDTLPYPSLQVWETYAHRTELRPYSNQMLPFDSLPHYSFGTPLPPLNPGDSFTLFDNLDENNEIGSCNMYAHTDKYDQKIMVLYQAKVNRDEYNYILNNYNTQAKLTSATTNTANNIAKYKAYYPGGTGTCDCPPNQNVICLPCGGDTIPGMNGATYTGAMEIKTAWRLLTPEDDTTKFFRRNVIYYQVGPNNKLVYSNRVFGLIGLHIIHKTQNYPAFIFATFEHVDVQKDNMGYVLLNNSGQQYSPLYSGYPRLNPIPAIVTQSTNDVHAQIKKMNPNSVWQNYQLIGVQAVPTNDSTSFSFFQANYVVESDTTLQDFEGSSIGNPHNHLPNTLYNGQVYSMGGCQGCHGVSQTTSGTDFSFLLDNVGKPVLAPDAVDSLPKNLAAVGKLGKLGKYIKATARKKEMTN